MLLRKWKIKNNGTMRTKPFKGWTFFTPTFLRSSHSVTSVSPFGSDRFCLPVLYYTRGEVYACPLFMMNIKKESERPVNMEASKGKMFPIFTFFTFSTSIFYNFRCCSTWRWGGWMERDDNKLGMIAEVEMRTSLRVKVIGWRHVVSIEKSLWIAWKKFFIHSLASQKRPRFDFSVGIYESLNRQNIQENSMWDLWKDCNYEVEYFSHHSNETSLFVWSTKFQDLVSLLWYKQLRMFFFKMQMHIFSYEKFQ